MEDDDFADLEAVQSVDQLISLYDISKEKELIWKSIYYISRTIEKLSAYDIENTRFNYEIDNFRLPSTQKRYNIFQIYILQNCMFAVINFVDQGVNPNFVTEDGETAISMALQKNNYQMIKYLIERGADPRYIDPEGNCYLHNESVLYHDYLFEMFLDFGVYVNHRNNAGETALLKYMKKPYFAISRIVLFLEHWADPTISDNQGISALHLMFQKDQKETFKVWWKTQTTPDNNL